MDVFNCPRIYHDGIHQRGGVFILLMLNKKRYSLPIEIEEDAHDPS